MCSCLSISSFCNLESGSRAEAEGVPHFSRSSSEHLVEDVVGSLLSRLGADPRLLQQVVRHMPTNHFKLRREGDRFLS